MHSATIATAPLIARRYGMSAFDLGGGLVLIVAARLDDSEKLRKRRGMAKLSTWGLPHAYITHRSHSAVHSLLCRVSTDKVPRNVPKRVLRIANRYSKPDFGFDRLRPRRHRFNHG